VYLRDRGPTEVGGFAICRADDLLVIMDVKLVRQTCSITSVAFDDSAVADFFDEQVDLGREPAQFGRIWVHTHPGDCPQPSLTDEETFARVFGSAQWAVMFILAQGGQTYARLQFNVGPGTACRLAIEIDFRPPFLGSDTTAWDEEYQANVEPLIPTRPTRRAVGRRPEDELLVLPNDPFYVGGDIPPFDFELQGLFHDGF